MKHVHETPATLLEASQLVFLDVGTLRFMKRGIDLCMTVEGDRSYLRVHVVRAFPLSEPHRFLSVRDEEEREIGLIADPGELPAGERRLIDAELERRYVMPVVTRIVSAKERFGTVDWMVETDRGACRFTTKNLRENVQRPAPGRLILTDIDENRFDIRDIDALNRESQALLYRHL